MATRSIADPKDRLTTLLIAPLMTCSARLPVYAVIIAVFCASGAFVWRQATGDLKARKEQLAATAQVFAAVAGHRLKPSGNTRFRSSAELCQHVIDSVAIP